jgi:nuclease S1
MKKRLISLALLFLVISLNAIPANAWGAQGHRIVAIIADRNLTDKTRQRIIEILGPNVSLASVANYADAVRNIRPETSNFHFVDIPIAGQLAR